jgi:hypothetical protein
MTDTKKPKRARRFARAPKPEALASDNPNAGQDTDPAPVVEDTPKAKAKADSKISGVVALLQRTEGATLEEMISATGWQPHTTRAALTGLKKKGHTITRDKRGDVTCYRIVEPA